MKPSKFNILTQSRDDPGKYLLYNTFQEHRIFFDTAEIDPVRFIQKVRDHQPLNGREEEAAQKLKKIGIFLDDDVDEQALFDEWYVRKIREGTKLLQVTLLPTMGCNLNCPYCFEGEVRAKGVMSEETTDQVVRWIQERLLAMGAERLEFTFFGGEPLLYPKPLFDVSRRMGAFCQEHGMTLSSGMITNGVLLTPENVGELKKHGLEWIKITFDGDIEEHDKKRITHSGQGTFHKIYDNLCAIQGMVKIVIGGNFDSENYPSMFALQERLRQSPFADDIVMMRFKPIFAAKPEMVEKREGRVFASACEVCSFNTPQMKGILSLREKSRLEGFNVMTQPEIGPCEFHRRHAVTIDAHGHLYKCPAFVGIEKLRAGHVTRQEFNEEGERELRHKKWDKECESCHFLPTCVGGCRSTALNQTGTWKQKSCEGNFLDKWTQIVLQEEMREEYALPSATLPYDDHTFSENQTEASRRLMGGLVKTPTWIRRNEKRREGKPLSHSFVNMRSAQPPLSCSGVSRQIPMTLPCMSKNPAILPRGSSMGERTS